MWEKKRGTIKCEKNTVTYDVGTAQIPMWQRNCQMLVKIKCHWMWQKHSQIRC